MGIKKSNHKLIYKWGKILNFEIDSPNLNSIDNPKSQLQEYQCLWFDEVNHTWITKGVCININVCA